MAYNTIEDRSAAMRDIAGAISDGEMIRVSSADGHPRCIINPMCITQVKTFDSYKACSVYMRVAYHLNTAPNMVADELEDIPEAEAETNKPWEISDDWWKENFDGE